MSTRSKIWIALALTLGALGASATPGVAYTETVLHSFCSASSCTDGGLPVAPLVQDGNGKLYGTTLDGGAQGWGAVFRYNPATSNYSVLYSFCSTTSGTICTDGQLPESGLIIDTSGNLYGTTYFGGTNGGGEVFELKKPTGGGAWTLQVLYSFCPVTGCADGLAPVSKLTYAGASGGNAYDGTSLLYGTTTEGGTSFSAGVIYALKNNSGTWSEKVIHNFCASCSTDGQAPAGTLFADGGGNLWGTTPQGGSGSKGIAFKLTHGTDPWSDPWSETILYNFCWAGGSPCADGEAPTGPFIKVGPMLTTFYGATTNGGIGAGIVYKLTNGSCTEGGTATFWCETVLYNFCTASGCTDGGHPPANSDIVMDTANDIFGTTEFGGPIAQPGGVVYEVSGTSESVLYAFCATGGSSCTDGKAPMAGVIMDSSGNFFGTTNAGGSANGGVLFKLTP